MALTRIPRLSLMNARLLYDTMGSATAVFEHRKDIRDVIPEANEKLVEVLRDVDEAIADAERENALMLLWSSIIWATLI